MVLPTKALFTGSVEPVPLVVDEPRKTIVFKDWPGDLSFVHFVEAIPFTATAELVTTVLFTGKVTVLLEAVTEGGEFANIRSALFLSDGICFDNRTNVSFACKMLKKPPSIIKDKVRKKVLNE